MHLLSVLASFFIAEPAFLAQFEGDGIDPVLKSRRHAAALRPRRLPSFDSSGGATFTVGVVVKDKGTAWSQFCFFPFNPAFR